MAQKEKAKSEPEIFTSDETAELISDEIIAEQERFREEFRKFAELATTTEPDSPSPFAKMQLVAQAGMVIELGIKLRKKGTPENLFEGMDKEQLGVVAIYACMGAVVAATQS